MNKGIVGSAGYGVGKVVIISDAKPEYENRTITDTDAEIKRYDDAVAAFTEKTHAMAEAMKESVGEHNAEILEGHILLLTDPGMDEITKGAIMSGTCAEAAFESTCDMFAGMFQMADDELTRQRATDIGDIKVRMLKILTGTPDVNISEVPAGTILVAEDLTPSMTAGIVKENVAGIITAVGGKTSHSAILARALEIPAVLSVDGIVDMVSDGMTAVVDGCDGICILDPSPEEIEEYQAKREKYLSDKALLEVYRGKDTVTADGAKVHLYGNIGNPEDAKQVAACDGEGVGLFRTEFLFIKIMVPLVTCVDEIRSVKALVKELMAELDAENIAYNKDIQVGAMIETPAASLIADLLAKEADFFSIGTNDLTQYTMAVDRGNAKVAYLYSSYNPAVLRSMKNIIEAANAAGIMVGMCGEAAADPLLIPLLISFGLGEFSVSATSVLATRGTIAKWSKAEADELAAKALSLATETEVAELLKANAR